jgi:hypothetical protein
VIRRTCLLVAMGADGSPPLQGDGKAKGRSGLCAPPR